MHKNFGFAKNSVFISILAAVIFGLALNTGVVSAVHTSSAELQPEWSPAGQNVDYTVTICNDVNSLDPVDEVRIYRNLSYTNFACADKVGWEKYFITAKQACQYVATDPAYYIDPNECGTFDFSATTPPSGCQWIWEFESRDLTFPNTGSIQYLHDTTSVDDLAPEVVKTVTGPQSGICPPGSGEECWVTNSTTIGIVVNEKGDCGISGLDYCKITYTIDGGTPIQEVYADLNGETSWRYSMTFDEDSLHLLRVECKDIAGNEVVDEEAFRVDSTPPKTGKTYGTPSFPADINSGGGYPHWITTHTPITLTPVDPEAQTTPSGVDCSIGVEKTWYYDTIVDNQYCESQSACEAYTACPSPYEPCTCRPKNDPQCVENAQTLCTEEFPDKSSDEWANCVEQRVNDVGNGCVSCDCSSNWQLYRGESIFKPEESCHILQYFSVDELGNREPMKRQCVYVDNKPPIGVKVVGKPSIFTNGDEILKAADRIIALQYTDGSWDWIVTNAIGPTGTTYLNIAGVTAEVLLDAYKMTGDSKYLDAAKKAGDYLIAQIGDPSASQRQNAFNVVFLYHLYDVTGDVKYNNEAFAVVEHVLHEDNYWSHNSGSYCGSDGCTASELLSAEKTFRDYGDPNGYVVWDLFNYIEAAQRAGETAFVTDLANDINAYMSQPGFVSTIKYYNLGLSGGIMGLGRAGIDYSSYVTALKGQQEADGSFAGAEESVIQTTSYALMALEYAGETTAAESAASYLVSHFGYPDPVVYNGWLEDDNNEYSEVTSEAAQALFDLASNSDIWVTKNTPITLTCTDQQPHPVDHEQVCYRITVDDAIPGVFTCVNSPKEIKFAEDSNHQLDFYCKDALGNTGPTDSEKFKVDTEPPEITKSMLGVQGQDYLGICPPKSPSDQCYVRDNGIGGVHVAVQDGGEICAVDQTQCSYNVWWHTTPENCEPNDYDSGTGRCRVDFGTFGDKGTNIVFSHDSTHDLVINCKDALGNEMPTDTEAFLVDSTPPVTTKSFVGAQYPQDNDQIGVPHWITSNTLVNLTATDNKVGVEEIKYRVTTLGNSDPCYYADGACNRAEGSGDFVTYDDPFTISESSCHLIEYYSVDRLGNTELQKRQCVFVDNTPPATTKDIGQPKVVKTEGTYISTQTPITLTCADAGQHPVDHSLLKYRYRYATTCDLLGGATWSDWMDPNGGDPVVKTIYFKEDSCHELEYYCVDVLGNKENTKSEIDIVDTQPPVITTTIVGPSYVKDEKTYIDGVTKIHVEATDPQPHPVDSVECEWYYILDDTTKKFGGDDQAPPFDITFPEETKHELHVKCWDALKNKAEKVEVYYVDKTPPVTTKTYGSPKFIDNSGEWVTSATPITLTVVDAGLHMSGIKETKYRVSLVDDKYCANTVEDQYPCSAAEGAGEWNTYTVPFTAGETSCHLIEYYSVDNVNKTEVTKKQCVFVDNTAPNPVKSVGEPKTKLENNDYKWIFYPEVNGKCWSTDGGIDCWEVTMNTPITLECSDPAPHPVDHNGVCFKVGLDGKDETWKYCRGKDYVFNESGDGFCCRMNEDKKFVFGEETEHNLQYYCVDALGNKGTIDDEKFKVTGTKFSIDLKKKWNLISVPYVLLNDDPADVFEDTTGVEAVWSWDSEHGWKYYTPANDGTDTLTSIQPGYGYWVLEKNDNECLLLGGTLFNTQTVPPSRSLTKGWNLIGYYGVNWQMYGYQHSCGGGSGMFGEDVYCALNSLIDTQQGYPRWSSLWTYNNLGNHVTWWDGLSTCDPDHITDKMYAGKGYWVEIDVPDMYAPASTCIWNDDFTCGGGVQLN